MAPTEPNSRSSRKYQTNLPRVISTTTLECVSGGFFFRGTGMGNGGCPPRQIKTKSKRRRSRAGRRNAGGTQAAVLLPLRPWGRSNPLLAIDHVRGRIASGQFKTLLHYATQRYPRARVGLVAGRLTPKNRYFCGHLRSGTTMGPSSARQSIVGIPDKSLLRPLFPKQERGRERGSPPR